VLIAVICHLKKLQLARVPCFQYWWATALGAHQKAWGKMANEVSLWLAASWPKPVSGEGQGAWILHYWPLGFCIDRDSHGATCWIQLIRPSNQATTSSSPRISMESRRAYFDWSLEAG